MIDNRALNLKELKKLVFERIKKSVIAVHIAKKIRQSSDAIKRFR